MIEVKNLLFQPLTLHTRSGRGLHLGPRERLHLPEDEVSPEMEASARRGAVNLTPVDENTVNEPLGSTGVLADPETETTVRDRLGFGVGQIPLPQDTARTARRKRS